jgi:hypothetical protein
MEMPNLRSVPLGRAFGSAKIVNADRYRLFFELLYSPWRSSPPSPPAYLAVVVGSIPPVEMAGDFAFYFEVSRAR